MANDKKTNPQDDFDDDFEAMLNLDSEADEKHIEDIDDEDAIDRLLMGDNFQHGADEDDKNEFSGLDALIAESFADTRQEPNELDDFDELFNQFDQPNKPKNEGIVGDIDEFLELEDAMSISKQVGEIKQEGVKKPEPVVDVDEFSDILTDDQHDFPDIHSTEFDISSDDHYVDLQEESLPQELPKSDYKAEITEPQPDISANANASKSSVREIAEVKQAKDFEPALIDVAEFVEPDGIIEPELISEIVTSAVKETPVKVDKTVVIDAEEAIGFADQFDELTVNQSLGANDRNQTAELANLTAELERINALNQTQTNELESLGSKIVILKKQIQVIKQELTEKPQKEELLKCLEEIDNQHSELKKSKRALTTLSERKPVAAYVANGIAATAVLIAIGFGFQGYIAKLQVGEMAQIVGKLQEQGGNAPASDAAEKEMLRKQVDELTVANTVLSNQVADINKTLQGDVGKSTGNVGKQLEELNNQNLQIGATLESLERKINALEKNKPVAMVAAPKPEKKKPVIEENWAVNLVSFKQDWYAKRKAEEYAAKGVPAKVNRAETKGETWYRLSVDGFKSQYEAANYAARVKKNLNLDSVWVTHEKE